MATNPLTKTQQSEKLIFLGVLLFFLGLVAGLFIPMMANPRMGLSTHLEGIMNGIFLCVLGLIWNKLNLPDRWIYLCFWLAIFGTFANFIAVLIAAISGAGRLMPIAGGKEGAPVIESIVSTLLITLTISMLTVSIIVLAGLYKSQKSEDKNA
jgi:hydroxylaminobenzene mutase